MSTLSWCALKAESGMQSWKPSARLQALASSTLSLLLLSGCPLSGKTTITVSTESTSTATDNSTTSTATSSSTSTTPASDTTQTTTTTTTSTLATSTSTPTPSAPAAPSALAVTSASQTVISLSWIDNSSDESGFEVYRAQGSGAFSLLSSPIADVTTYADTSASANITYSFKVRAINSAGNSEYSSTVTVTTLPGAPTSASALTATVNTAKNIGLSWTSGSAGTETGFKIERSTSSGSGFAQIASVATGITSYSDTSVTQSTQYYYRVRVYVNGGGGSSHSGYTSEATATTPSFTPDLADGLALWLRSDRGISTDTNTTTTVSLWADQSGNGRDLAQGLKALQPTYVTGELNGYPILRFDGASTYLKAAYSAGLLATRAALFVVYKPTASQTNFAAGLPYSDNTSWADPYVGIQLGNQVTSGRFWINSAATNSEFTAGTVNPGTYYTQALIYDGVNKTGTINGTSASSTAMGSDPTYSGQPKFVVGTRSADALGEYLGGDIAEIIFYNSALSETNRIKIETYLNAKYSIY